MKILKHPYLIICAALFLSADSIYAVDKTGKLGVSAEKLLLSQPVYKNIEDAKTGEQIDKSQIVECKISDDTQYGLNDINWRRINRDEILFWGSIYEKRESVRIFKIHKIHTKPEISYLCTLKTEQLSAKLGNLLLNDHNMNCHELYFSIDEINSHEKGFEGVISVMGDSGNDFHEFAYAFRADKHGAIFDLKNIKPKGEALDIKERGGAATTLELSEAFAPSNISVNTIQVSDETARNCFVYVRYSTTILDKNNKKRSCSHNEIYQILPNQSILDSAFQKHGKLKQTSFSHVMSKQQPGAANQFLQGTAKFDFTDGFVLQVPYVIDKKGNLKLIEQ